MSVDPARAAWRRSSRSANGNCIEVAEFTDAIGVRDSKDPSGPALEFSSSEWSAFVRGLRDGQLHG